ncbi:fasciclin domain-containing protein [Methanofollis tationis]|uniref:Fasciclin domain-containing protein n=1 Tax=Methanofollis tationis TaxID=81417 RepID=A0A7K4HLV4_9EURY|nr:fasciclin domain-containing protein [Methanofollis tationis]NVO65858.1 fasciclin domain-containing protein [Methanofollis tationis]
MKTIVETAIETGEFTTLVKAVQAADLVNTLNSPGPFTVFAPNDAAFAKLPKGTVEELVKDKERLKSVLTYHVVAGKYMAADVMKMKSAKTVQGGELMFDTKAGVKVNNAQVIKPDVLCSNGVCHVIDAVLMPK